MCFKHSIKLDAKDNLYVAGDYHNDLYSNNFTGGSFITRLKRKYHNWRFERRLNRIGNIDGFVARFNPNGKLLWMRKTELKYDDGIRSITVDTNGNTYALAEAYNRETLSPMGCFVIKYNHNSALLWQKRLPHVVDYVSKLAVDAKGYVYIVGSKYNNLDLSEWVLIKLERK